MITLFVITLVCAVATYRLAPRQYLWAWLGALFGFVLLAMFGLEVLVRGSEFFVSDENGYLELGRTASITTGADRYLWILINAIVMRHDLSLSGLPLKLLSLPLLALQVTLLWRIFDRDRLVWWIPILLPYVAYVATMNLRDTAILTATVACVFFLDRRDVRLRLLFLPALAALYLLRPFVAIGSTIVWFGILGFLTLRKVAKGRLPVTAIATVVGSVALLSAIFAGPILDRAERYLVWYQYTTGEGLTERAENRGLEESTVSGYSGRRVVVGVARYALAPLPTSLFLRMLEGGSRRWGAVDDTVRMIHQTLYFLLLGWLLLRWRSWIPAGRSLSRGQVMLLAALFLYLPVYSLYLFGVSHQRLKIPFQIAVALFAIVTLRTRQLHAPTTYHDGLEDDRTPVRRQGSQGM